MRLIKTPRSAIRLLSISATLIPFQSFAAPDTVTLGIGLNTTVIATPQAVTELSLSQLCPALGQLPSGELSAAQTSLQGICSLRGGASASELSNFYLQASPKYASSLSNNITIGNNVTKIEVLPLTFFSSQTLSRQSVAQTNNANRYKNQTDNRDTHNDYYYRNASFNPNDQQYGFSNGDNQPLDDLYLYNAAFSPGDLIPDFNGQFDDLNQLLKRTNTFLSAFTEQSDRDISTFNAGYDNDSTSILLGTNYRATNKSIVGAALQITSAELDLKQQRSTVDSEHYNFSLFGSYQHRPQWLFDASISSALLDYDTDRTINFSLSGAPTFGKVRSSTRANQWEFNLGSSYDWSFSNAFEITALGSFNFTNSTVKAYQEKGNTGLELNVDKQTNQNSSAKVLTEIRRAYGTRWGAWVPQAAVAWVHQFGDQNHAVNATFAADPNAIQFGFNTEAADSDYFNLLVGSYIGLPRGLSAFIQLESVLGLKDYSATNLSLGFRTEL